MRALDEHFNIEDFGREMNELEADLESEPPVMGLSGDLDDYQRRRLPVVTMLTHLYSETQWEILAASLVIEAIGPQGERVFQKITTDAQGRPLAWPAQRAHVGVLEDASEFDMGSEDDE